MSGETAKVILDLCQALEKHLNKQPYHTKTSDDLAWEAGCKWLGNNAATPPGYEMVPEGTRYCLMALLHAIDPADTAKETQVTKYLMTDHLRQAIADGRAMFSAKDDKETPNAQG